MTELRKGDKVSVTGTVKYTPDAGERVFVAVKGGTVDLWVDQSEVKLVQAKFEVGDKIAFVARQNEHGGDVQMKGEILAISGEHAWIEYANGEYYTRTFSSIERLPDEEPEAVEPGTAAGSLD